MTDVTVKELAGIVGVSVNRLLAQLDEAGIAKSNANAVVHVDEKLRLLEYLRRSQGCEEPLIAARRNHVNGVDIAGSDRRKPVNVEVRGKPTTVGRAGVIQDIIQKYKIDGLWHFTDRTNLESISESGGLLSYAALQRRGIVVPAAGGNDWSHDADKLVGVDEYVHLAFIPNHPMLYRARNDLRIMQPCWLKIDISILEAEGIRFTREVANKSGARLLTADQAAAEIDWEVLFTRTDWSEPEVMARRLAAEKSEVLIPNIVPLEKILESKNG